MLQLVQRFDQGLLPASLGIVTYQALWASVQTAMFHTHVESTLKADIIREPEKYVQLDPEMAATLLDMKEAGKQLILITNSDWQYTKSLMSFAYDRCAPQPPGTAEYRHGAVASDMRSVTYTTHVLWPRFCVAVLGPGCTHAGARQAPVNTAMQRHSAAQRGSPRCRYLPSDMTWRDLFQVVCVQARKPSFWSDGTALLRIVSEDGLMEPAALPEIGSCYFGGSARLIEKGLGLDGDQFLYIGDHIYTDAALAKLNFKCVPSPRFVLSVAMLTAREAGRRRLRVRAFGTHGGCQPLPAASYWK